jgi:hypothetical protein
MKREQLSIRLEPELAERLQRLVDLLDDRPEYRTLRLTRADVMRMALFEGLLVLDERFPRPDPVTATKKRTKR